MMLQRSDGASNRGAARNPGSIEIAELSKHYGSVWALDRVSLSVKAGEFVAMLGPSGSGKSTLLMAVAGFIRPDSGRIHFGGEDVVRLPANRRGFGVVFQNYALFPHMNVLENVAFPLRVRKCSADEQKRRAEEALETVKLGGYGDRQIGQLSGGQKQRVALARAIVFEPSVLLMDEPLSALDKNLREQMQIEIRELHDKLKITTLYVTHDQREALTIADRVAVMDAGKIVQIDSPEKLYRSPTSEFVARFIGEAAIIPVDHIAGLGAATDRVRFGVIRSEDFYLERPSDPAGWCHVKGTLHNVVFQGESWLLRAQLQSGESIDARVYRQSAASISDLEPGQEIVLYVKRDEVHTL
jgi:putative spermidine/putrescine transport system ATP-binding protein